MEPYVNECLKMQTYAVCYEPMVMPMNGLDMWEDTGFEPVGPPPANAIATGVTSAITKTFTNAENGPFVPLPQGKRPKRPRRKAIDTPRGKIKPWVSNVPLPEIWAPPPSWKGNSFVTKETLMAASQIARYRETFNILDSQESVHAPPSFRGQSEKGQKGSHG
nr:hypothetical protein CFP56_36020 [Quercus suber]